MSNPFSGTPDRPYHLSIGAVLVEGDKFLAHKFDLTRIDLQEAKSKTGILTDTFYSIMTETPEEDEGFLDALVRGCMEEFGANVELIGFIGTHIGHFARPSKPDINIEKSMPFFLCRVIDRDDSRRPKGEIESKSDVVLLDPEELAQILDAQFKELGRTDFDLGNIVRRAQKLL